MKKITTLLFTGLFFIGVYAQQSYPVTFTHEGKTVYGTFTVPNGAGPFPAIIINPGTGANDRDGTLPMFGGNVACLYPDLLGYTLRPYKQLSDALVAAGYAVLRYDKLEFTYTTPAALGPITFRKLWLPIDSAVDYLKTRDDVDSENIVLIGHSEGSSIIPFIAKNRDDIKALVSVAGPRTPLDSLLAYQFVYIAQECNGDVGQAQAQANQVLSYFNIIRTNMWNAGTPDFAGVPASEWYEYILAVDSVAINYNLTGLPALFTGFGLDINVPLSELSRFQDEVSITEDFWSIPDLNHYMTPNDDPDVSAVLTDTIIYWLNQHITTSDFEASNPEDFSLRVFPNPFQSTFSVAFNALKIDRLDISISNIFGQEITREHYQNFSGNFLKEYSMNALAGGVYFLTIDADGHRISRKVVKR